MATLRIPLLAAILLLGPLVPVPAQAPATPPPAKKPGEAVTLGTISIKGEAKPGTEVTAVIQFKIEDGWHVQANPASEPTFIPAVLKLDPAPGLVWSPPVYPAAKEEKVAGLAKPLKVYENSFEITVPLRIGQDAKLPARLTGVLSYQACKGLTCFPPKRLKVELPVGIKAK